jgi:2-oxoglutarate dehydrogenase E2 component (dihydrolipoamide succinyltransferase)
MGESLAEGTLVKWYKKVGDSVRRDEPLFEISTDKVDTEVPSSADGYVLKVLVKEGETVPVHTVVCLLGDGTPAEDRAKPGPESKRTSEGGGAAPPVGRGGAKTSSSPVESPGGGDSASSVTRSREAGGRETRLLEKSSPLVRRLAAEHGIDLKTVRGTGTDGRVTKDDILRSIEERKTTPSREASPAALEAGELEERIEPMSVMRQRIADHMVLSRKTSAHVTSVFEVDMTGVRALKDSLLAEFEKRHHTRLTYLPFIVQAVARALRRFPLLNAAVEGKNIHYHGEVNLGVAVALDDGLIVPVVRNADRKDLPALAKAINDLAQRARSRQLKPDEVQGGTFTITNPGVFGSLIGTPIINQPQVGILCVGAIQKRPVVLPGTDAIAVRSMVYLSLTFDHRLVDGAVADRFLAEVKSTLESTSLPDIKS